MRHWGALAMMLMLLNTADAQTANRAAAMHPMSPEIIQSAMQAAFEARGWSGTLGAVDAGSVPLVNDNEVSVRVLDVRYDAGRQRWNARMMVNSEAHPVPFLVTAPGTPPKTISSSEPAPHNALPKPAVQGPPLFRAGQRAALAIRDRYFNATIPVVCLDGGRPGDEIRVRDTVNGKVHRARISSGGEMQLSLDGHAGPTSGSLEHMQ